MDTISKYILMILLAALMYSCKDKRGPIIINTDEFTEIFCRELKSLDNTLSIEVRAELEIKVINQDGRERTIYLYNAYQKYQSVPEQLNDIIGWYARSLIETAPENTPISIEIDHVVPVVKSIDYPIALKSSLIESGYEADKLDLYYEKINEVLVVLYAINSDNKIKFLSEEEVDSLGISREQLRLETIKNMRRILPEIGVHWGEGVYMVMAGGIWEANLILLDSLWTRENFKVQGDFVVAIPSQDLLFVTGSEHTDIIDRFRIIAKKGFNENSYPITEELFIRREGEWIVLEN
ncbi:MAG: DUF1444 family protein [Sedimentisphaerales bacterium]|nr:DUF1444 family protein [Sedimentisphaerales bacterium]